MAQYVYKFDPENDTDGGKWLTNLLGGKGANLAEMAVLGLPVPPGVTVTTEVFSKWQQIPTEDDKTNFIHHIVLSEVLPNLEAIAKDYASPVLWSVRSGAPVSMPGMLDTILNVGVSAANLRELTKTIGLKAATDCRRRFMQMFADVVLDAGIDSEIETLLEELRDEHHVANDADLPEDALGRVCVFIASKLEEQIPEALDDQLTACITAVFKSWDNDRAKYYRQLNAIPEDLGTAVTIQLMVFGNAGAKSGSGVLFSSDPSTGSNDVVGEYLSNAQGEDVVAGARTPLTLEDAVDEKLISPGMLKRLHAVAKQLEAHYKDMQDVEFTIEDKSLYILQTRTAKRTGEAAINFAMTSLRSEFWTPQDLPKFLTPRQVLESLTPRLVNAPITSIDGIAAGVGVVSGVPCHTLEELRDAKDQGLNAIFITDNTSAEDLEQFDLADGIVTMIGGFTSHAAVVARSLNKPCVVGCAGNTPAESNTLIDSLLGNDTVTIDGARGKVYDCELEVEEPDEAHLADLIALAGFDAGDEQAFLDITNLDAPLAIQMLELRLKHSSNKITLQYDARRPGALRKVVGLEVIPTNLSEVIPRLMELYDPENPRFELSTDYNLDHLSATQYGFIVRSPSKPSDYLTPGSLITNDQILTYVFGTLEAAYLFLDAADHQGVPVATAFTKKNEPIKNFLNFLHTGN
ncbi:PEP-utilizing enzyme [Vibrio phage 1.215.B._10N.222.54.F7]|nr:PEP-utilizing enzyme [Vibrio phage 1.215.A._10N.222.54.F7]AUR96029.1 PEP-utilizing enzyme [Vibrio phage 1.215.B._10N.222.54.F7]